MNTIKCQEHTSFRSQKVHRNRLKSFPTDFNSAPWWTEDTTSDPIKRKKNSGSSSYGVLGFIRDTTVGCRTAVLASNRWKNTKWIGYKVGNASRWIAARMPSWEWTCKHIRRREQTGISVTPHLQPSGIPEQSRWLSAGLVAFACSQNWGVVGSGGWQTRLLKIKESNNRVSITGVHKTFMLKMSHIVEY